MPTSPAENAKIVEILQRHKIPLQTLLQITNSLDEEVGQPSDNQSVKTTMKTLYELVAGLYRGKPTMVKLNQGRPTQRSSLEECDAEPATTAEAPYYLPRAIPEYVFKQYSEHPDEEAIEERLIPDPRGGFTPRHVDPAYLILLWLLVVAGHTAIWFGLLMSCVFSFFYEPLYVSMPIISFVVYLLISPHQCPITRLENMVRHRLGWRPVPHFSHYYIICPIFHRGKCFKESS